MKIQITDNTFLNWKFFSSPERVHVLLLMVILADDDGYIVVDEDKLSFLTRLMVTTIRRCIADFEQDNILVKAEDGRIRLNLYMGLTPIKETLIQTDVVDVPSNPDVNKKMPCSVSERPSKRFVKPTLEEVTAYVKEKGYTFSPVVYMAHYESCGWVVGRNKPMKSWKAACVTFQENVNKFNNTNTNKSQYEQNRNNARATYLASETGRTFCEDGQKSLLDLIPE